MATDTRPAWPPGPVRPKLLLAWRRLHHWHHLHNLWQRLALLAMLGLLSACSTLQLAYPQAPTLLYWRINDRLDLNGPQSVALRQDLSDLLAWHRQAELPLYADALAQWRRELAGPISAAQVCRWFDWGRQRAERLGERSAPALARLAQSLTPEQIAHWQGKQAAANAEFEDDFLRGNEARRLQKRLERTVKNHERLYGKLNPAQRQLLEAGLRNSPFDAAQSLRDRQAQQAGWWAAWPALGQRPLPEAETQVRQWLRQALRNPEPSAQARSQAFQAHSCAQLASLHNSTSPAQRAQAAQNLRDYEADFRALAGAGGGAPADAAAKPAAAGGLPG